MKAKQSKLLRCPFCGGKAKLSRVVGDIWSVLCQDVRCFGRYQLKDGKENAINAWNRRVK